MKARTFVVLAAAGTIGAAAVGNSYAQRLSEDPPGGEGTLFSITCDGGAAEASKPGIVSLYTPGTQRIGSAGFWVPRFDLGFAHINLSNKLTPTGVAGDTGFTPSQEPKEGETEVFVLNNPLPGEYNPDYEVRIKQTGPNTEIYNVTCNLRERR